MDCLNCNADNDRNYPVCPTCSATCHFTNRADCRCNECLPAPLMERFPGLVLLATSEDPPELRRVEFGLDAIKPEYRLEVARDISEMLRTLAARAA